MSSIDCCKWSMQIPYPEPLGKRYYSKSTKYNKYQILHYKATKKNDAEKTFT